VTFSTNGEKRTAYRVLSGNPGGEETTWRDLDVDRRIILKSVLKKCGMRV
jgi:hypothetical protein